MVTVVGPDHEVDRIARADGEVEIESLRRIGAVRREQAGPVVDDVHFDRAAVAGSKGSRDARRAAVLDRQNGRRSSHRSSHHAGPLLRPERR